MPRIPSALCFSAFVITIGGVSIRRGFIARSGKPRCPWAESRQLTANRQQPTASRQQPTANSQPPAANSSPPNSSLLTKPATHPAIFSLRRNTVNSENHVFCPFYRAAHHVFVRRTVFPVTGSYPPLPPKPPSSKAFQKNVD